MESVKRHRLWQKHLKQDEFFKEIFGQWKDNSRESAEGGAMKVLEYTGVVWRESDGYVSKCPELGVASCGDTFEEAVSNLQEAVDLYLENAQELGLMADIEDSLSSSEKYTAHLAVTVQ